MQVSSRLKAIAAKAIKAEIAMAIEEYDRLIKRMQLLCDSDPTEKILADLRLTVCQSKILANKIYQLRHRN